VFWTKRKRRRWVRFEMRFWMVRREVSSRFVRLRLEREAAGESASC
jgi:hypothetical protein